MISNRPEGLMLLFENGEPEWIIDWQAVCTPMDGPSEQND
jgi:hypothetical protein